MKDQGPTIVAYPPGPRTRQLVLEDHKVITHSAARDYPLSAVSGRGCFITDIDGNVYLDFSSADLCTILGHGHPEIVEAVTAQARDLTAYSYHLNYSHIPIRLAVELARQVGEAGGRMVYFGASAEDAVEAAVKVAEWHTRNRVFLSVAGSHFGETSASLDLSSDSAFRKRHMPSHRPVHFLPSPYCFRCPFHTSPEDCDMPCVGYFEEAILGKIVPAEDVAALFFETIMVNAGCIVPPEHYYQKIERIAEKNGIITVANESNTCMGRTGSWFAFKYWSIHPEMVVMSNSLAEGLPLSALISDSDVMDWTKSSHSTTMGGNLVACASSIRAIEVLRRDNLLENANREGIYLRKRLTELKARFEMIGDVRGKGLLVGVELVKDNVGKDPAPNVAREVVKKCWRRGLILKVSGESTIQISPPLTVSRELIDRAVEILEGALEEALCR